MCAYLYVEGSVEGNKNHDQEQKKETEAELVVVRRIVFTLRSDSKPGTGNISESTLELLHLVAGAHSAQPCILLTRASPNHLEH